MRRVKLFLTLLISISAFINASSQEFLTLHVKYETFGKSPLAYDVKLGDIDRKHITTVLYVYLDGESKETIIPINDKVFNYEYFNKHVSCKSDEISLRPAKIKAKKYLYKGKEIFVAFFIEFEP